MGADPRTGSRGLLFDARAGGCACGCAAGPVPAAPDGKFVVGCCFWGLGRTLHRTARGGGWRQACRRLRPAASVWGAGGLHALAVGMDQRWTGALVRSFPPHRRLAARVGQKTINKFNL